MTKPITPIPIEDLKPCPFCGGRATDAHLAGSAWFIGGDHADDCHFADFQRTEAEAIAAWNTRSPDPPLIAEVENLRSALVALADGAEKIGEAHHIVQPLLAIYRKHGETIAEARAALSGDGG
jgi:hypothetical protein